MLPTSALLSRPPRIPSTTARRDPAGDCPVTERTSLLTTLRHRPDDPSAHSKSKTHSEKAPATAWRPISECKTTSQGKNKKGKWVGFTFSALWRFLLTYWRRGLRRRDLRPCRAIREPALQGHQTTGRWEGGAGLEQRRYPCWDHARPWHSLSTRTCYSPKRSPHTGFPSPPRPTRPSTHLLRPEALESSLIPLSLTHP